MFRLYHHSRKLSLDIFYTYSFFRIDNSYTHPFFIKDQSESNQGLNLSGDGDITSGIKNEETFLLSFDTDIDLNASISYFCTSHALMNFEVEITALEKIANIENNSIVSNLEIGKTYTLSSIRDFDGNFHAKKVNTSDMISKSNQTSGSVHVLSRAVSDQKSRIRVHE